MRALKIVLISVLSLIVVLVLVAGYFGFMPGVSSLFGSDKPRDLGIKYTEQDYRNAWSKAGIQLTDLPADASPKDSLKFSGQNAVKASFTSEELTAWINDSWKYTPVSDAQIRVNADGTVEMSGLLDVDSTKTYAEIMGVDGDEITAVLEKVPSFLKGNMPVYMKVSGSASDNNVIGNVEELEVGRFKIPSSQREDSVGGFTGAAERQIHAVPGTSVKSLSFANGQAQFDGTLPAVVSRTPQ